MYMLRVYDVSFHRENSFTIVFSINCCIISCYVTKCLFYEDVLNSLKIKMKLFLSQFGHGDVCRV